MNREFGAESALSAGERAMLRAGAEGVDIAIAERNPDGIAKCVRAYLELRQACGLTGNVAEPLDPFAAFVAGMSAPSVGDGENT